MRSFTVLQGDFGSRVKGIESKIRIDDVKARS